MIKIAEFINSAVSNFEDDRKLEEIKSEVKNLCSQFPLYSELK